MKNTINSYEIVNYKQEISYNISEQLAQLYWSDCYDKLNKIGLMIIKPEAIYLNKVGLILNILEKHNFELIIAYNKKLTPSQTNEIWKNSWINSSNERILINHKLFSSCDSIILFLRYRKYSKYSTCELLTNLKGPAIPKNRKPWQIRSIIQPINLILNYVHTSDTTGDLLREVGIIFDIKEIIQIFNNIDSNFTSSFDEIDIINMNTNISTYENWIYGILETIINSDINSREKEIMIKQLQNHLQHSENMLSFELLILLSKYEFINWNFSSIVIISNHIKYLTKY